MNVFVNNAFIENKVSISIFSYQGNLLKYT